jgi:high-affinity K+ transport system ATPase subunit B
MTTQAKRRPMFDSHIMRRALLESFRKLDPRLQIRNPVMFVVLVGSVLTTVLLFQALFGTGEALALVHCAVCELCRSDGGRAWKGTGGIAAQFPA